MWTIGVYFAKSQLLNKQPVYSLRSSSLGLLFSTSDRRVSRFDTVGRRAFAVHAPWSGTRCRTTSTHSRTTSPLDRAWKPGFSLDTSVFSALETSWQCAISIHNYHTIPDHCAATTWNSTPLDIHDCDPLNSF